MRWKCSNSGWRMGGRARKKNIASMSSLCRANAQMMRATFVTFLITSSCMCVRLSLSVSIFVPVCVCVPVYMQWVQGASRDPTKLVQKCSCGQKHAANGVTSTSEVSFLPHLALYPLSYHHPPSCLCSCLFCGTRQVFGCCACSAVRVFAEAS